MAAKITTQYTIHYSTKSEQNSGQLLLKKFLKTMLISPYRFYESLQILYPFFRFMLIFYYH